MMITRLAALALLLAAPLVQAQAAEPTRAGPSVTVATVERRIIAETVLVNGSLVAREEVLVAAQLEGLAIVEVLADEGDRVAAGQRLARLDRASIDIAIAQNAAQRARAEAAIAQARSQIVEATAAAEQAQAAFERVASLRRQEVASQAQFDQAEATQRQTAARVVSTRQALALAEAELAVNAAQLRDLQLRAQRTDIVAPVEGVVSRRSARLGAIASGAAEPLFRLIQGGVVELEAEVAEAALARLRPGQRAEVSLPGREAPLPGEVRLVLPEVARATRLGRVRIALPGAAGLAIGSFARAVIELDRKEATVVPLSSVLFGPEGARVQVVTNGVVESRIIQTGLRAAGQVEAVAGVSPGETVVAISGTFLRSGDRVTPIVSR